MTKKRFIRIPSLNIPEMRPQGTFNFNKSCQTVTTETVTVIKILTSVSPCIFNFYDCTKFRHYQVAEIKVIDDQQFQTFSF